METDGRRVIRWANRSLEPEIFEEEGVPDSQALSAAIKQLMASSGISARNMIASVGGLYSLSRIVLVPTPPGGSVTGESVLETVREQIPLSEEEAYLYWRAIGGGKGGQQVLVLGIPRDVIDNEMQVLKTAGIRARVLELKAIALARAVGREQAIILNIEPSSYDIVVVMAGITEVMRTTAWQTEELTTEDEAERLAVALELTAGFYNSSHPNLPLDPATPLFITGQMSGDLALMENLQSRVGYLIEPLDPPIECPVHLPVSQYAVNIGLALRGAALPKNPEPGGYSQPTINLLPDTFKPWRPSRRQIYLFLAVAAAVVLLFPLYRVTVEAMGKVTSLKTRYELMNAELERRKVDISQRLPLQTALAQYSTIVSMGGGFVVDIEVIRAKAEELGVQVTSINLQSDRVLVNCQADSYTSFRAFLTVLDESGLTAVPPPEGFPYRTSGNVEFKHKPAK